MSGRDIKEKQDILVAPKHLPQNAYDLTVGSAMSTIFYSPRPLQDVEPNSLDLPVGGTSDLLPATKSDLFVAEKPGRQHATKW